MQTLRQALLGLFLALLSVILILGSFTAAFAEELPPTQFTLPPAATATLMAAPTDAFVPTPLIGPSPTQPVLPSPTLLPSPTATIPPPTACPPPPGWLAYIIYPGDSLPGLAQRFYTTTGMLVWGNCLYSETLIPGYVIYVPPAPPPTRCSPPFGWVPYTLKPGDNLYRIGLSYGLSATELQRANCMPYMDTIYAGSVVYVPNLPTQTPFPPPPHFPPPGSPPPHFPPPIMPPTVTSAPYPPAGSPPPIATIVFLPPATTPAPTATVVLTATPLAAGVTVAPEEAAPTPSLTPTP